MATAPRWSELPTDVLDVVFRHLCFFGDHVRASAVCPQWRTAAVENPPPLPLLILPPTAAPAKIPGFVKVSDTCWKWRTSAARNPPPRLLTPPSTARPAFVRVFGKDIRRLPSFPDDARCGRICRSFPGGWVALSLETFSGLSLLNFYTGEREDLPDLICTPSPAIDCVSTINSVTLSATPTRDGSYLVAAVMSGVANVAFWRPGAERWCSPALAGQTDEQLTRWRMMLPRDPVEDMLYFGGRLHQGFYVLNAQEELVVYVPEIGSIDGGGSNGDLISVRVVRYFLQTGVAAEDTGRVVLARYLVESRGDLLMICHLSSPDGFEVFSLEGERSVMPGQVHATWRRCPVLPGRALFLGHGCSMALETGIASHVVVYCLSDNEGWFYP